MKGPIAAQIEAAARTRGALRRPLVLLYSYAEEVGCHGAMRAVDERGVVGDVSGAVAIVGEPTSCVPILAHKGYCVAKLRLMGQPAHSKDPWAGADASVALGVLLVELHALREALRREGDPACGLTPPCTTLNTGVISAGTAENVVPDRAEMLLEWPPPLPPFRQDPGARLVTWLVDRTGNAPGTVAFYTEAELYRAGLGVPTVVCGPGTIEKAHRVDESIEFDELEAGATLYADAIGAFCG